MAQDKKMKAVMSKAKKEFIQMIQRLRSSFAITCDNDRCDYNTKGICTAQKVEMYKQWTGEESQYTLVCLADAGSAKAKKILDQRK